MGNRLPFKNLAVCLIHWTESKKTEDTKRNSWSGYFKNDPPGTSEYHQREILVSLRGWYCNGQCMSLKAPCAPCCLLTHAPPLPLQQHQHRQLSSVSISCPLHRRTGSLPSHWAPLSSLSLAALTASPTRTHMLRQKRAPLRSAKGILMF